MDNNTLPEEKPELTPDQMGGKIIDMFQEMPDDEQVRFFVSYVTAMLNTEQQKSLVRILQGRLIM